MTDNELLQLIDQAAREEWTELDLSGKDLTALPAVVGQLTSLKILDLRHNQLTTLPETIGQLINLETLVLYDNQLTTLPETIGQLTQLATLNLHYNQLTTLPETIAQLTHLITLNLRHNQFTTFPKVIDQLVNLIELNLRHNQLTAIPDTIGQLRNLSTLDLHHNQLINLPEAIGQLTRLTTLDLYGNQLATLPEAIGRLTRLTTLDLYGNQLATLPEAIGQLTHLTTLDLSDNQLATLPEAIGQLTHLTTLDLSGNQLTTLPNEIRQLANLTLFDLSFNLLSEVPESVAQLTNLNTLNLSCNRLISVPESLGQLADLLALDLSFNQLERLPQEVGRLQNLMHLDLNGNPPTLLPLEIRRKSAKEIVNFYRQQIEQQVAHLYEAKLLIVGEPGAGKTTLTKKIQNPDYQLQQDEFSTEGIDVIQWHFLLENGREFRINIWDFGGQEIYHSTHQFFLTKRSLYALVVDTRKEDTDFYYWLNSVELLSNNSPLLIIKNEKQDRPREINERELRGQFANLRETLATNLATNRNLPEILRVIKHYISTLPHVGTPLPRSWVEVRKALEQDPRNYISLEEYLNICQQYGFTRLEDKLQLSDYLHDLGVCLHFQDDDLLRKTVILKTTWGTDAVYKVLDNVHIIQNQGRFNREDLADIWHEDKYATMHPELLKLMMRFKLCYEIPSCPNTYIAPQLLSPNQPEYSWDEADNMILRYEYEFMPKGILTHFMVEIHHWIENQTCVWRNGIILSKGGTRAEVIEYYRYHKGEIKVRVAGKRKKELLTIISHELDKIHNSFECLKYSKLIPCNCVICKGSQYPHFYRFEILQKFLDDRQYQIQCQNSYRMVDVRSLMDDVIDVHFEQNVKQLLKDVDSEQVNSEQVNSEQSRGTFWQAPRQEPLRPDITVHIHNQNLQENRHPMSGNTYQYGSGDNIAGDKVMGDKIGTQINHSQNLAQAASDIKALLDRLSMDYSNNTAIVGAKAIEEIDRNPTLKERVVKALQEAGSTALEKLVDHPAVSIVVAGAKGFMDA